MIVFDLACRAGGHRFEGWFGSSDDYARQSERGLVACPECGSVDVAKAPMTPSLARKGNQQPAQRREPVASAAARPVAVSKDALPPEAARMMLALAEMQAKALEKSRWVGDSFADASRAIHYGERDAEPIHGQATFEQARELLEEGIDVAPLPFPVVPPGDAN